MPDIPDICNSVYMQILYHAFHLKTRSYLTLAKFNESLLDLVHKGCTTDPLFLILSTIFTELKRNLQGPKLAVHGNGPCTGDTLVSSARRIQMAIWFVSPAIESAPLRSEAALE